MQLESIIVNGLKINGYSTDYVFQTIKQSEDFYESTILKKWTPYIEDAKHILDVGANLGNHTIYWATYTACEAIYSFEPFPPNFEVLKANIQENRLEKVVLINKGVGADKGFAEISSFDENNYGGTTLLVKEEVEDGIELVDIDSFASECQLEQVDFVKIDTEGFEVDVLAGMKDTLTKYRPDLWIEVTSESFSVVLDMVADLEYVLADIEGCNILLLNKQRHDLIKEYSRESAIVGMFCYLDKTNKYYKNYLTMKSWLNNKDIELCKYKELITGTEQKYQETFKQYQVSQELIRKITVSIENLQKENNCLKQNMDILQENNNQLKKLHTDMQNEYVKSLLNTEADYEHMISVLKELNRKIQTLEVQNGYLKSENNEYRRKLSLITDTKLGSFALKIYRKLQILKAKLKR